MTCYSSEAAIEIGTKEGRMVTGRHRELHDTKHEGQDLYQDQDQDNLFQDKIFFIFSDKKLLTTDQKAKRADRFIGHGVEVPMFMRS